MLLKLWQTFYSNIIQISLKMSFNERMFMLDVVYTVVSIQSQNGAYNSPSALSVLLRFLIDDWWDACESMLFINYGATLWLTSLRQKTRSLIGPDLHRILRRTSGKTSESLKILYLLSSVAIQRPYTTWLHPCLYMRTGDVIQLNIKPRRHVVGILKINK